jgi:hypothetical protein
MKKKLKTNLDTSDLLIESRLVGSYQVETVAGDPKRATLRKRSMPLKNSSFELAQLEISPPIAKGRGLCRSYP